MTKLVMISEAAKMLDADPELRAERYSAGKYKWLGSQMEHIEAFDLERENLPENIRALYFVRGTDDFGPYVAVWCLTPRTRRIVLAGAA